MEYINFNSVEIMPSAVFVADSGKVFREQSDIALCTYVFLLRLLL